MQARTGNDFQGHTILLENKAPASSVVTVSETDTET